ncbi:MAG: hypothetical protein ACFFGZ_07705 [Candidatus Thorarchaeota archaeon]
MVFRFKKPTKVRSYIEVLIFTFIVLSIILTVGLLVGIGLGNSVTNDEVHPLVQELWDDNTAGDNVHTPRSDDPIKLTLANSDVRDAKIEATFEYPDGRIYGFGRDDAGQDMIFQRNINDNTWKFYDYMYASRLASVDEILEAYSENETAQMLALLLVLLIINVLVAVIIAAVIASFNPYGRMGVGFNLWLFRRLKGRLGRWLNATRLFDFDKDDQWYIERHLVYDLELHNSRAMIRELLIKRWRDFWFLPAAIVVFLVVTFRGVLEFIIYDPNLLAFEKTDSTLIYILMFFLMSILVSILIAFYYPGVWSFTDIGLKKYRTSEKGDIEVIQSLGSVIRNGSEIVFGATTILSLSSITNEFFASETPLGVSDNFFMVTFEFFRKFAGMLVFFFLIVCFVLPPVLAIGLVHFSKNHMRILVETRKELVKTLNTPVGTLQPMVELSTSDDAIQVYSDGELEQM